MVDDWDKAIVTHINLAMYVAPGTGATVHNNRAYHGFVLNDKDVKKRIHFSNGIIIESGPYELHYLPKHSNYLVEVIRPGGCWAINFDLSEDFGQPPLNLSFRNPEPIVKVFKSAVDAWIGNKDFRNATIRKYLYDIITKIRQEQNRNYIPDKKEIIIQPAVDYINRHFAQNGISVNTLAALCNISEAYFRRIFLDKFALTPKEYIIKLRMEHAKLLLESAQFSVSEIARMSGYYEPCHFSREFSKHTGLSPIAYAKTVNRAVIK